jgi:hypothetical protein
MKKQPAQAFFSFYFFGITGLQNGFFKIEWFVFQELS